ncbi:UPF0182 family protein [bacterium]|nr:UPF0182 family protein [bacterium]
MKVKWNLIITVVVIGCLIFLLRFLGILGDYYWFDSLSYQSVYLKILFTQIFLFLGGFLITAILLLLNFRIIRRVSPHSWSNWAYDNIKINFPNEIILPYLRWALIIFISLIMGFIWASRWESVLTFLNRQPFTLSDPVFNLNASFYTFVLPLLSSLKSYLLGILIISIITSIIAYISRGILTFRAIGHGPALSPKVKAHLSILFAILMVIIAFSYLLTAYSLVYSPRGVVFGASYADVYGYLSAYRVLIIISLLMTLFLLLNVFLKMRRFIRIGVLTMVAGIIILNGILPGLLQKLLVEPNELKKEERFIKTNIEFTRKAYNLDKIQLKEYEVNYGLNLEKIYQHPETINNIRLWDWRPLMETYKQLQEIRLYYDFPSVDIDRYYINGQYRQVMLAPRELNYDKIPSQAKTWVNQRLKYTHGYGLCLSPVNEINKEGQPQLMIKDIPPVSSVDLKITRPEIYYGKKTDNYVIVKTKTKEFDYPVGDKNEYTFYEGDGGIILGSFFKRIIYATKLQSLKLILSGYFTKESRLMLNRNLLERVHKIAPFLRQDHDPYMVISEGRLFWIMDAYTVTDKYPYSEPFTGINYIRNSVKIVIDAYHGTVDFYIIDPADPLICTYKAIFPKLFKPFETMPPDLKDHLRYPEDLFMIQSRILTNYHMEDPEVFYNKEDMWDIPMEIYENKNQQIQPYYVVMEPPEMEGAEFILMMPFTPARKSNMVSWLCARCDGQHYGELLLYKFPKKKLIYGPMQIEAKVDQNTTISEVLTLWSQKGSNVIRGNLLVLPIEGAILYVEPLFLKAEQSQLPELKRVIVGYENRIVMAESFDKALLMVFSDESSQDYVSQEQVHEMPYYPTLEKTAKEALESYNNALQYLQNGNWENFGREMNRLQEILQKLAQDESY